MKYISDEEAVRRNRLEGVIRNRMKKLAVDYRRGSFRRIGSYLAEARELFPLPDPNMPDSIDIPEERITLSLKRFFPPKTIFAIDIQPDITNLNDRFLEIPGLLYDNSLKGLVKKHFGLFM